MSARNKLENKSLRRRERKDFVPQICLSAPNSNAGKLARKLKVRPLAKLFTLFKRAVRRARYADRLIAKLPPNKVSPMLFGIAAHTKAFGRAVLAELDRREKLIVRTPAAK